MAAEARGCPRAPEAEAVLGLGLDSPDGCAQTPRPLRALASALPFPEPSLKAEVPPWIGPGAAPDSLESVALCYPPV